MSDELVMFLRGYRKKRKIDTWILWDRIKCGVYKILKEKLEEYTLEGKVGFWIVQVRGRILYGCNKFHEKEDKICGDEPWKNNIKRSLIEWLLVFYTHGGQN